MMTLKDIAVKRSNHLISLPVYSENIGKFYGSFESFASEFPDNDQDILLFKWEIIFYEGDHSYYMEITSLNNEDGKVTMSRIQNITESDTTSIMNFLKIHYEKIQQLWMPFSKQD